VTDSGNQLKTWKRGIVNEFETAQFRCVGSAYLEEEKLVEDVGRLPAHCG